MKLLFFPLLIAMVLLPAYRAGSQEFTAPTTVDRIESPVATSLNGTPGISQGLQFGGWLDPQRFSMSHSYGLTFTRWGNQSLNYGVYTNRIEYKISNPLTLRTNISILHQPFSMIGGNMNSSQFGVLPSFQLEYRPSENMRMSLDVQIPVMPNNSQFRNLLYQPYGW
jgi:hypothetical protein